MTSSNTNDETHHHQQQQQQAYNTQTIRHAGSVHVRGMIRRVWRPRYLEVYDSGIVKYYETTPSAASVGLVDSSSSTGSEKKEKAKAQLKLLKKIAGGLQSRTNSAEVGADGLVKQQKSLLHEEEEVGEELESSLTFSGKKGMEEETETEDENSTVYDDESSQGSTTDAAVQNSTSSTVVSSSSNNGNFETQLVVDAKNAVAREQKNLEHPLEEELNRSDKTQRAINKTRAAIDTDGGSKNADEASSELSSSLHFADATDTSIKENEVSKNAENKKDTPIKSKLGSWDHLSDATSASTTQQQQQPPSTKKEENTNKAANQKYEELHPLAISEGQPTNQNEVMTPPAAASKNTQKKTVESPAAKTTSLTSPKHTTTSPSSNTPSKQSPPPSSTTTPKKQIQQHRHRPKTTLNILSVRIIDPSSLRDIHVGLPKGSWGFVFKGQQQAEPPPSSSSGSGSSNAHSNQYQFARNEFCHPTSPPSSGNAGGAADGILSQPQPRDYLCAVPTAEEARIWLEALKYAASKSRQNAKAVATTTAAASTSRTIDGTAITTGNITDEDDDEEEESSTGSWTQNGFASLGRRPNAYEDVNEQQQQGSSSLFANTIATARKKAVLMANKSRSLTFTDKPPVGAAAEEEEEREEKGSELANLGAATTTTMEVKKRRGVTRNFPSLKKSSSEKHRTTTGGGDGIICVTKARRFLLPPLSTWPSALLLSHHKPKHNHQKSSSLEVVYEIRMLLLRGKSNTTTPSSSSFKTKSGGNKPSFSLIENAIEEQIIYRTYTEFTLLIHNLIQEYGGGCGVLEDGNEIYTTSSNVSSASSSCSTTPNSPMSASTSSVGRTSPLRSSSMRKRAFEILCQAENELFAGSTSGSTATTTITKSRHEKHATTGKNSMRLANILHDIQSQQGVIRGNIEKIDKILQLLSTNGELCNSILMRRFLDLVPSSSPDSNNKQVVSSANSTFEKQTNYRLINQEEETIDNFVKRWLSSDTDCIPTSHDYSLLQIFMALQNQWILLFVIWAFSVFCFLSIKLWWMWFDWKISVRIDVLGLVILGVGCMGYRMGSRRRSDCVDVEREEKRRQVVLGMERSVLRKDQRSIRRSKKLAASAKGGDKKADESLEASLYLDTDSTDDEEEISVDGADTDDDAMRGMDYDIDEEDEMMESSGVIMNPVPFYPGSKKNGIDCWSNPNDNIFCVRGPTYLQDRVKLPSAPSPFKCRGVEIWLTDNAERHIARHPSMLGGKLHEEDTFMVNFLLPFGNFVSYFSIPPMKELPPKIADVWSKFVKGDQQYRDARLKLLPVVIDGPWIVRKAVGKGTAPALLGKVIPLQYYFRDPDPQTGKKGIYEIDVIISGSRIAKGILNVVKGHTSSLTIAFAYIIEAALDSELPETVLCSFQMHSMHLDQCQPLPHLVLDT